MIRPSGSLSDTALDMNFPPALNEPRVTRHLKISGRVQGVWYRDSMCLEAQRLGVTGWVRNRHDGSVEALVQGPEAAVADIIAWTRQGPPDAKVDKVEIRDGTGSYRAFVRQPDQ